jgi:hypothetical protein
MLKASLPSWVAGQLSPSMEVVAGQRTVVKIYIHHTTSTRKTRKTIVDLLDAEQPVMVQVDMGFLPDIDFDGEEYHFGGLVVVLCGYDLETEQVLIANRDGLYPISHADLVKARSSTFKPPPQEGLGHL